MNKVSGSLTVFFEHLFWVGVFECTSDEDIRVCRIMFKSEPKDVDVYAFVLEQYHKLKFTSYQSQIVIVKRENPKRLQRSIRKQVNLSHGIGTKSQQALKLQQEETKMQCKTYAKQQSKLSEDLCFQQKQAKRKKKQRGR